MKPREKLEKQISVTIRESFHKGFDSESVTELDNFDGFAEADETLHHYAIGKWVPVDERLPDMGKGEWRGYVKFNCGSIDIVTWHHYQTITLVTHWLDLDLPEWKDDA